MESLKNIVKNWIKSIFKTLVIKELISDCKKVILKTWNHRFSIISLLLCIAIIHLYIDVQSIKFKVVKPSEQVFLNVQSMFPNYLQLATLD